MPGNLRKMQVVPNKEKKKRHMMTSDEQVKARNVPRGPNILKKNSSDNKMGRTSFVPNTPVIPRLLTIEKVEVKEPAILQVDDEIEEVTDYGNSLNYQEEKEMNTIAILTAQLEKAHRQLEEKNQEAEKYKQQLRYTQRKLAEKEEQLRKALYEAHLTE